MMEMSSFDMLTFADIGQLILKVKTQDNVMI